MWRIADRRLTVLTTVAVLAVTVAFGSYLVQDVLILLLALTVGAAVTAAALFARSSAQGRHRPQGRHRR